MVSVSSKKRHPCRGVDREGLAYTVVRVRMDLDRFVPVRSKSAASSVMSRSVEGTKGNRIGVSCRPTTEGRPGICERTDPVDLDAGSRVAGQGASSLRWRTFPSDTRRCGDHEAPDNTAASTPQTTCSRRRERAVIITPRQRYVCATLSRSARPSSRCSGRSRPKLSMVSPELAHLQSEQIVGRSILAMAEAEAA